MANVDTDRGTREKIRFIDTEGLDDPATNANATNRELPRHYHALADGFVIVYSIDDERSFQLADAIRRDIERNREKKEVSIVVLGNKSDLSSRRQVETVQALNWAAREKVKLFEVSSLDRESLYEPFVHLSSKLNPPPNKSTFSIGRKQQKQSGAEG